MDQLKSVLTVLKKYHFWALVGLVLVALLAVWSYATADMAGDFNDRVRKLQEQMFDELQRICGDPGHPNEEYIENTKSETEEQKKIVHDSWKTLYEKQKALNKLPGDLSPRFKADWEDDWQLSGDSRSDYQYFIRGHFDTLFKDLDLLRPAEETEEGEPGAAAAEPGVGPVGPTDYEGPIVPSHAGAATPTYDKKDVKRMVGTVDWDESDRNQLKDRFQWSKLPSTSQVRLAQEDLWVYEALLRVIKNTNELAVDYEKAAVKRIEALEIGQDVVGVQEKQGSGYYARPPAHSGSAAPGGSAQDFEGYVGGPQQTQLSTAPQPTDEDQSEEAKLKEGRYVDDKGRPLGASEKHPFAEYKIMPIRMKLLMNQTKIPKLLVECANSSMPIEVRRVRLNPGEGRPLDLSLPETRGPGGAAAGYTPKYSATRSVPRGFQKPANGARSSLDIPVEIEAIICIYNPPDPEKVGTGAAGEKPPEDTPPAAAPATPPAAAPATRPEATPVPSGATPGPGPATEG